MRAFASGVAVLGLVAVLCASACTPEPPPPTLSPDGGPDAGVEDAGLDAGSIEDGGDGGEHEADAGTDAEDAGEEDAGTPDAGEEEVDAGCPPGEGIPPNLLPNPSFECGTEGWSASLGASLTADETLANEGGRSARLSSASGASVLSLFPTQPPAREVGAGRFCAEAFVQAAPGTNASLTIRATTGAGGAQDQSFTAPMDGTWQRLQISQTTLAVHDQVTVRIGMPNAPAGAVLHVDDVALWASPDGGCARE